MKELSTRELREQIGVIEQEDLPIIVKKYTTPVFALVSFEEYEELLLMRASLYHPVSEYKAAYRVATTLCERYGVSFDEALNWELENEDSDSTNPFILEREPNLKGVRESKEKMWADVLKKSKIFAKSA
jgi:hypothetical protein